MTSSIAKRVVPAAALACAALLVAGCATNSRTVLREIQDVSGTAANPLARIAVVAIDHDAATRRVWEDAFAARLNARGVTTTASDALPGRATLDAGAVAVDGGAVIEAARNAGAEAILFVQPPQAVPMASTHGAYRWLDARSSPDPRTDLDTAPASVTEVRLYNLKTNAGAWRAMVLVYYPPKSAAEAGEVADAVAAGLAKRGFLRGAVR